jgi:hypothetical protein
MKGVVMVGTLKLSKEFILDERSVVDSEVMSIATPLEG